MLVNDLALCCHDEYFCPRWSMSTLDFSVPLDIHCSKLVTFLVPPSRICVCTTSAIDFHHWTDPLFQPQGIPGWSFNNTAPTHHVPELEVQVPSTASSTNYKWPRWRSALQLCCPSMFFDLDELHGSVTLTITSWVSWLRCWQPISLVFSIYMLLLTYILFFNIITASPLSLFFYPCHVTCMCSVFWFLSSCCDFSIVK